MKPLFSSLFFCLIVSQSFAQFSSRQYVDQGISFLNYVEAHDMNLDGHLDIVVAGQNGLVYLENQNDGSIHPFSKKYIFEASIPKGFQYFKVGDLNADGFPDVVAADPSDHKVSYFENNGDGTFAPEDVLSSNGSFPTQIDFGDIDGDDDIDVVVYFQWTDEVIAYKNSSFSPGNFSSGTVIYEPFSVLYEMRLYDCDEDGDLDILHGSNVGLIRCLTNPGDGNFLSNSFTVLAQYATADYRGLTQGDIDGDGDDDVLAFFKTANTPISIIQNSENGVFEEAQNLLISEVGLTGLKLEDTNNDNLLDIVADRDDGTIVIYENEGNLTFSAPETFSPGGTLSSENAFTFAKFNDDNLDIVRISDIDMFYMPNDGNGEYPNSIRVPMGAYGNGDVDAGDLDGDGLIDIIVTGTNSDALSWYKNLGNGTFSDQIILMDNFGAAGIALADFDGDGHLDIVANGAGNQHVFENLGNGSFAAPILLTGASNVFVFDSDGDGDMDIFNGTFSMYENLGNFNFANAKSLNISGFSPFVEAAVADLDLDGDLDIVGSSPNANLSAWLENTGGNNFTYHEIDASFDSPFDVFPYDLNDDDYPDLVVGSRDNEILVVYYNNGNGTFQNEVTLATNVDYPRQNIVEDFDNDGDGDILCNISDDKIIGIYGNLGNGNFASLQIIESDFATWQTIAVDLDNDLDRDLISVSGSSDILWFENFHFDQGSNIVEGGVFLDENENGVQDVDEKLLQNFKLNISPTAVSTYSSTSNIANFRFFLEEGSYTLSPNLDPCWELTTSPTQYEFEISEDEMPTNPFIFGVKSINPLAKASVSLTAAAPTRCGFTVPYYLTVENTGCTIIDGTFGFALSDLVTFSSAFPPEEFTQNDTLFWTYSDLYPGDCKDVYIELVVAGPDAIGEFIQMQSTCSFENGLGNLVFSESDFHNSEIRCAYDPNDKLVKPARSQEGLYNQNFTLFSETLEYTVRFQNTGNDTAFTVTIHDYLSTDLDWTTFEPGAASHEYRATLHPSGLVEFVFEDILLPDSLTNEPGSHGFVSFQISAKENLPDFTSIFNSAEIYFDFNPPIFTNAVENVMVETLPLAVIPDFAFTSDGLIIDFQDMTQNDPESWLWTFGDGNQSTEQNPTHSYDEEGMYEVCLTTENLISSATYCETIQVMITNVFSVDNNQHFQIFPNPTNGITTIKINQKISPTAFFEISDVTGKTYSIDYKIESQQLIFETATLPKGISFFKLVVNQQQYVGRFIVE